MPSKTITGKMIRLTMKQDGTATELLDNAVNCEVTFNLDAVEHEYLGEATPRHDVEFNGAEFKVEAHHVNDGILDLIGNQILKGKSDLDEGVILEAQIDIQFKNRTRTVIMPDSLVVNPNLNAGGRKDKVSSSLSFKCANPNILPA